MTDNSLPPWAVSLKEHIDKQLELRDRANVVAVEAMNKRLEGMNEFRDTLRDQAARLTTREEHNVACQRIDKLERWQSNQEGKASQSSVMWATVLAVMGLGLGVAGLIIGMVR